MIVLLSSIFSSLIILASYLYCQEISLNSNQLYASVYDDCDRVSNYYIKLMNAVEAQKTKDLRTFDYRVRNNLESGGKRNFDDRYLRRVSNSQEMNALLLETQMPKDYHHKIKQFCNYIFNLPNVELPDRTSMSLGSVPFHVNTKVHCIKINSFLQEDIMDNKNEICAFVTENPILYAYPILFVKIPKDQIMGLYSKVSLKKVGRIGFADLMSLDIEICNDDGRFKFMQAWSMYAIAKIVSDDHKVYKYFDIKDYKNVREK